MSTKNKTIEAASLFKSFKNALSFLSQSLGKALEEIVAYGLEVEPVKVDKDHLEYIIDCGDLGELHVWADISENSGDDTTNVKEYHMKMDFEGHKKDLGVHEIEDMFKVVNKEFKAVTGKDLKDVQDEVEKSKVNSSTNIRATFRKIQCGKDTQVDLTNVMCYESPSTALMVINDVLSDDDFVDSLPVNEDCTFELTDNGDECELCEVDEIQHEEFDSYEICRVAASKLFDILHTIHVNAKDKQFEQLHTTTGTMIYDIQYQIDTLAEWSVQYFGFAKSWKEIGDMYQFNVNPQGYTYDEALPIMIEAINEYMDCLNLYYCNMSKVAQTTVDNWLGSLDKIANYKMKRTQL